MTLSTFRINTYEKQGEGDRLLLTRFPMRKSVRRSPPRRATMDPLPSRTQLDAFVLPAPTLSHQRLHYPVEIKNLKLCHFAGSYVGGKSCGHEYACYIPS